MKFSIGIVTFNQRFDEFKTLIQDIRQIESKIEIFVQVNGNVDEEQDQSYLKQLYQFCSQYQAIYLNIYPNFRSLCKLWNDAIIHSSYNWTLLLNDDVRITNSNLFKILDQYVTAGDHQQSVVLNKRWSHVLLNRKEIEIIGWFDERFLGIGDEDHDIEWRYEKHFGHNFKYLMVPGIENIKSYKVSDKLATHGALGFSIFNNHFFHSAKYKTSPNGEPHGTYRYPMEITYPDQKQYPYEKFYWENKDLLSFEGRKIIFGPEYHVIHKDNKQPAKLEEIVPFKL